MTELNKNLPSEGEGQDNQVDDVVLGKGQWRQESEKAYIESVEKNSPLTILLIDVNYFKSINDTFGHDVGDEVIADIHQLMNTLVYSFRVVNESDRPRELDVVSASETKAPIVNGVPVAGHIGGDEFAVIARTDEQGAKVIVQRLIDLFNQYINDPSVPGRSRLRKLGIGLAIGTATTGQEGVNSASDLIRTADLNMYENKLSGLDLSEHQKKAVRVAWVILKEAGVRIRDVPKIIRMHPELFEEIENIIAKEASDESEEGQVSSEILSQQQRELLVGQAIERERLRQRQIQELKAAGLGDFASEL